MELKRTVAIVGVNFTSNHLEDSFSERSDIIARLANEEDKEILWELREEIFETVMEIEEFIEKRQVFLFEQKGKTLGLGIFSVIISTRPEHDIGMAVSPEFRKQGIGTYIINYLREHCRKND